MTPEAHVLLSQRSRVVLPLLGRVPGLVDTVIVLPLLPFGTPELVLQSRYVLAAPFPPCAIEVLEIRRLLACSSFFMSAMELGVGDGRLVVRPI